MFNFSFPELFLIAVIALVVLGPERLPKVARTLGHLFGRAQRYASEVKAEINKEMALDELRKTQAEMQSAVHEIQYEMTDEVKKTEQVIQHAVESVPSDSAESTHKEADILPAPSSPQLELGLENSAAQSEHKA
jgi:sec-independent protein translocase protein TatB